MGYAIFLAGCFLEAIFQTHHRGSQSWIQVLFVARFMSAGFCYMIIQALMIILSLFKIATGTVGGWVVTARKAPDASAKMQKQVVEDEEAPTGKAVTSTDDEAFEQ